MNSFDLMMERYKRELVDANRRSIGQELLSQSETSDPEADIFVPESEEELEAERALQKEEEKTEAEESISNREAVSVNAEPPLQTHSSMQEPFEPEANTDEKEPLQPESKSVEHDEDADSFGTLKVQVFAAQQVYPIASARVIVRRNGEDEIIFEGYTDSSGIVDNIKLPTPGKSLSSAPNSEKPYSQYDVFVTQPNFVSRNYIGVPVFSGVESIQTVRLVPKQFGTDTTTVTTESEPNELLMKEKGEG